MAHEGIEVFHGTSPREKISEHRTTRRGVSGTTTPSTRVVETMKAGGAQGFFRAGGIVYDGAHYAVIRGVGYGKGDKVDAVIGKDAGKEERRPFCFP